MYYVFKVQVDFKKETNMTGEIKVTIPFNDVIVETDKELTESQLEAATAKIRTFFINKFNINNIDVYPINQIK